ncbi:3-beta-hydroxysteroid-delta-isomerase [Zostera marina]|uniref:3-beta-hydroxysteroid-delta-isomerase n=1 Tax=Zostera marina TaxID=29655 RepID=A0A0K9NVK7_ZOSMR|nr:3-beta-hydroxysteroid-delta-isomerase [Zostera marina]
MSPAVIDHPYVPRDLILPGFVPCVTSIGRILAVYGFSSIAGVFLVWILSGLSPKLTKMDRTLMCWWLFTGLTHMIIEGYFVFSPEFFAKESPMILSEIWKEYGKGDSRYVSRDSAVVSVEGITAVLTGPASFLSLYAIWTRKPYSYTIQFAASLAQLYGCLVYFLTSYLDGDNFYTSRYYYWAYYITANAFWVVIPTLISIRCWNKISSSSIQSNKNKKNI